MSEIISAQEVKQLMESGEGVVILDVLPRDSYASKHLPGAVNVPVKSKRFEQRVQAIVPDKTTPIVAYCTDTESQLSPEAVATLHELGYERVWDFEDGLQGWHEAGYGYEHGNTQPRAWPFA